MMDFSTLRTLRDEAEYEAALVAVRPYFDDEPAADTPEAANFDALTLLIEDYEARFYPIGRADPVSVVKSVMAANNYTRADLIEVVGSKARASDLLNGRREINLDQIRKLNRAWHIPAAALIDGLAA
jgi:HTH-type transcriptional regulator/antitoxin HigA